VHSGPFSIPYWELEGKRMITNKKKKIAIKKKKKYKYKWIIDLRWKNDFNIWEDQMVEVVAFAWAAFRPRQPRPSSSPSLCVLPDGSA
jgi:hypothetical protein